MAYKLKNISYILINLLIINPNILKFMLIIGHIYNNRVLSGHDSMMEKY